MTKLKDKLLLVSCVDYLLEHGGRSFIELIIGVKKQKRKGRFEIDPLVFNEPLSLNLEISEEDENPLLDLLIDERKGPMEIMEDQSTAKLIESLIQELRPKEQQVICMRFGLRGYQVHTLESVGHELEVTRERVRQIEASVLKLLRKRIRARSLEKELI